MTRSIGILAASIAVTGVLGMVMPASATAKIAAQTGAPAFVFLDEFLVVAAAVGAVLLVDKLVWSLLTSRR